MRKEIDPVKAFWWISIFFIIVWRAVRISRGELG